MPIGRAGFSGWFPRLLIRPLFRSLAIPASGLSAQRQRIDVIASNIANAETTRTPEGGPYRRRVVELEAKPYEALGAELAGPRPRVARPVLPVQIGSDATLGFGGVRVVGVREDASEGPLVYDPGHPDADAAGYVRYPNVRITEEMVDLLEARRVYEANATVFQAVKSMLRRAIEI